MEDNLVYQKEKESYCHFCDKVQLITSTFGIKIITREVNLTAQVQILNKAVFRTALNNLRKDMDLTIPPPAMSK